MFHHAIILHDHLLRLVNSKDITIDDVHCSIVGPEDDLITCYLIPENLYTDKISDIIDQLYEEFFTQYNLGNNPPKISILSMPHEDIYYGGFPKARHILFSIYGILV